MNSDVKTKDFLANSAFGACSQHTGITDAGSNSVMATADNAVLAGN